MPGSIHYEVFLRQGSKGDWSLHDVTDARESALEMAQGLMAEKKATGVKVIKETLNAETGGYLTLKIFEDGKDLDAKTKAKKKAGKDDIPAPQPCFRPEDFYTYHARAVIGRLLGDFLSRNKLTVTEFLHRADAIEKFEATDTLYQHAIQKIAVVQASDGEVPVQKLVKNLNDLATKAIAKLYRDEHRAYFPAVKLEEFKALVHALAEKPDGGYILNGAIANFLRPYTTWKDKLFQLFALMDEVPAEDPGRTLMLDSIDAIVAELLNGSAALHELIGESENLGAALSALVELFLARPGQEDQTALGALGAHFAAGALPAAHTAIANRILAELTGVRRLCPESLVDELKSLRRIANRLVLGQGKYLSHEELIGAFTLRSKRLVTHECVTQHLAEAEGQDGKLERLCLIEENIIGAENKRQLAGFAVGLIASSAFEQHFLFAKTPVLPRLNRLAELQARVLRTGFQEDQRAEIADALDRLACEIEARAKVIDGIEAKQSNNVDKAVAILRLFTGGHLTQGKLAAKARERIVKCLSAPGFFSGYMALCAHGGEAVSAESAMGDLMETLEKAGITRETGLKSIAA